MKVSRIGGKFGSFGGERRNEKQEGSGIRQKEMSDLGNTMQGVEADWYVGGRTTQNDKCETFHSSVRSAVRNAGGLGDDKEMRRRGKSIKMKSRERKRATVIFHKEIWERRARQTQRQVSRRGRRKGRKGGWGRGRWRGGAPEQSQPFREGHGAVLGESYPGNTIKRGRREKGGQVNRWLTDCETIWSVDLTACLCVHKEMCAAQNVNWVGRKTQRPREGKLPMFAP